MAKASTVTSMLAAFSLLASCGQKTPEAPKQEAPTDTRENVADILRRAEQAASAEVCLISRVKYPGLEVLLDGDVDEYVMANPGETTYRQLSLDGHDLGRIYISQKAAGDYPMATHSVSYNGISGPYEGTAHGVIHYSDNTENNGSIREDFDTNYHRPVREVKELISRVRRVSEDCFAEGLEGKKFPVKKAGIPVDNNFEQQCIASVVSLPGLKLSVTRYDHSVNVVELSGYPVATLKKWTLTAPQNLGALPEIERIKDGPGVPYDVWIRYINKERFIGMAERVCGSLLNARDYSKHTTIDVPVIPGPYRDPTKPQPAGAN